MGLFTSPDKLLLQPQMLLKECQAKIDARDVLDHYGAMNVFELNGELIHSCLLDRVHPHHSNGDTNPSAALHTQKLKYNCFSLGGGDLIWFIQQMEELDSVRDVLPILSKFFKENYQSVDDLLEELDSYFKTDSTGLSLPYYHRRVLDAWLVIHPYMTIDRGIHPEVLKRYSVGWDESVNKIVIPHFWKGTLVGWQKRKLDSPHWPKTPQFEKIVDKDGNEHQVPTPKYKNSKAFPKYETLYNWDTVKERKKTEVLVVESVLSVLKAETFREQGDLSWDGVLSTFGSKVTDHTVKHLSTFEKVIVWFDNDKSGWYGALKLIKQLSVFTNLWIVLPEDNRDLADLTHQEAIQIRETALPASLLEVEIMKRINGV